MCTKLVQVSQNSSFFMWTWTFASMNDFWRWAPHNVLTKVDQSWSSTICWMASLSLKTSQLLKKWLQIMFWWGLKTLSWFQNNKRLLVAHGERNNGFHLFHNLICPCCFPPIFQWQVQIMNNTTLKVNTWKMLDYEVNYIFLFPKIKVDFFHTPLKLHVLQWYNCTHLFLFSQDIPPQKIIICFIQIQMVIKNL
jgi:hypothetical protein